MRCVPLHGLGHPGLPVPEPTGGAAGRSAGGSTVCVGSFPLPDCVPSSVLTTISWAQTLSGSSLVPHTLVLTSGSVCMPAQWYPAPGTGEEGGGW